MSEIKDGGQAFPLPITLSEQGHEHIAYPGMTLRDYFAAKAIQSHLITHPDTATEKIAAWSYEVADAMIKARSQS